MSVGNHRLVLLRHGETGWSRDRKHTSHTDLDLTENGRDQAKRSALTLDHLGLDKPTVVSSPRRRAVATVRYGFGTAAVSVCGFEYGLRQLSALGLTS